MGAVIYYVFITGNRRWCNYHKRRNHMKTFSHFTLVKTFKLFLKKLNQKVVFSLHFEHACFLMMVNELQPWRRLRFAMCLQCRRWRPWRRWPTAREPAAPQWWTRTARRFEGSPGGHTHKHTHAHTQLIPIYFSHDEAISCPGCYSRFTHVLFS